MKFYRSSIKGLKSRAFLKISLLVDFWLFSSNALEFISGPFSYLFRITLALSLHLLFYDSDHSVVQGSLHSQFYNSDLISGPRIPAFPILKFGPNRRSMDPCIPLFKIRIDTTVRGSLYPFFKFGSIRPSVDPCIPFFMIRTIQWSKDLCIPNSIIRTKSVVQGSLHSPFYKKDQIGGP